MNSLSQLNSHSRTGVAYADTGTYNISLTETGANIGGKPHTIFTHMPPQAGNSLLVTANTVSMIVPIDFTALSSVANTVIATYALYQTAISGTYPTSYLLGNIFVPNTLPGGTTVARQPTGDIVIDGTNFRNTVTISGINSTDAWSAVRLPVMDIAGTMTGITVPTLAGNIFFTYANGATTSFTFRNILTENSNLKISNANAITYNLNQPKTLTAYPTIWANIVTANVYVMPSISSAVSKITSAGTGGTTVYDQYSRTLTITGNGTQINTHLATLTVTPATDSQADIFLNYTLRDRTTSGSGFNSNVSQSSGTSSNVAIHAINQSFTANAFTRTRTFTENGYGLLFPDHVPVVANVGTGNYTVSLTLSSDSGIIGLGESFTSPVGWTSANLNYSYTGNLTITNTTLSSLRYFARPGSALKPVVTYTQRYNGTVQFTTTFALLGQANAKIVGGTTRYDAYEEQVITDVGTAEFYPSVFSNYVVMYRGIHGGIDNNAVTFTAPDANSTVISNAVIYRQFAPAANLTAHVSNLSAARTANIRLGPDYTNDVDIEQILGIESYVTGSSLGGGSQYRAFKPIRISPTSEFSLTDAYSVPWDWRVPLDIVVTDYDVGAAQYTANIRQVDFATKPGWLVFTNNANVNYGNITVTGTKSNINAVLANVSYYRPLDSMRSLSFDGSSYLSVPYSSNFEFGSGDYTIEFWMYSGDSSDSEIMAIPGNSAGLSQNYFYRGNPGGTNLTYYSSSNGTNWDIAEYVTMGSISPNTWYHVAVSRSGSSIRLFLNGALTNTFTFAGTFTGTYDRCRIGDNVDALNYNGLLTSIRVVKGTAVYTSAFTPSTNPLTAISGTQLLLDRGIPAVDRSANNLSVTAVGSITTSETLPPGSNNFRLEYTQSKVSGNVTSAVNTGNIAVNNSGSSTFAVSLPATATLGLVTNTFITGTTITDPVSTEGNVTVGNIGKTYSFSLTQSNPIGYFWLNGANVGAGFTTYGNITNINATIANIGFDCNTATIGAVTNFTSNVVRQIVGTGNVTAPQFGNTVISAATCVATTALQNLGDRMGGGYYAGKYSTSADGVATHYLVVAPRLTISSVFGTTSDWSAGNIAWITPPDNFNNLVTTAYDGATNTATLAGNTAIVYGAARYCDNFTLDKYSDWYLPSYYELEVVYYNLKPYTGLNDTTAGANPYSVGTRISNYTSTVPSRTTNVNFKLGAGGNGIGVFVPAGPYYQYYCTSTTWGTPGTTNGPVLIDFGDGTKYSSYTRSLMSGQANVAIRPMRKISV